MYINGDFPLKFIIIKIHFADLNAKNEFKHLTKTDPVHNPVLDFESIFPLPSGLSIYERRKWKNEVWGSDGLNVEHEEMSEAKNVLNFHFTTNIGLPVEFAKNLYLYSRIKKIVVHCIDAGDVVYANDQMTGPCIKRGCTHEDCDPVNQELEVKYDWSRRPHPILEVAEMLNWIKDSFRTADDKEVGQIYHQFLLEVVDFRKLAGSGLVNAAKEEFERQVAGSGNAYLQTMVMLNDYERPPKCEFKGGRRVIYKCGLEYYLKKTQPVKQFPRFPNTK